MGKKHLHRSALAAPEVDRVAAGPGVRGVADGAERLLLGEGLTAVIAVDGAISEVYVVFTTDLATLRASPTNRHRARHLAPRLFEMILARDIEISMMNDE